MARSAMQDKSKRDFLIADIFERNYFEGPSLIVVQKLLVSVIMVAFETPLRIWNLVPLSGSF